MQQINIDDSVSSYGICWYLSMHNFTYIKKKKNSV